jgi:hypothetical protein
LIPSDFAGTPEPLKTVFAIELALRPAAIVAGVSIVVISIVNNAVFIALAFRLLIAISFFHLPPLNVGVCCGCTPVAQH